MNKKQYEDLGKKVNKWIEGLIRSSIGSHGVSLKLVGVCRGF